MLQVAHGMVKSTALYVGLSLPVNLVAFGISVARATDAISQPEKLNDWVLAVGFIAIVVLAIDTVVDVVEYFIKRLFSRRYRSLGISLGESLFGRLGYAFVRPWGDGIRTLPTKNNHTDLTGILGFMSTSGSIIRFCWAIALIVYLGAGFVVVSGWRPHFG